MIPSAEPPRRDHGDSGVRCLVVHDNGRQCVMCKCGKYECPQMYKPPRRKVRLCKEDEMVFVLHALRFLADTLYAEARHGWVKSDLKTLVYDIGLRLGEKGQGRRHAK